MLHPMFLILVIALVPLLPSHALTAYVSVSASAPPATTASPFQPEALPAKMAFALAPGVYADTAGTTPSAAEIIPNATSSSPVSSRELVEAVSRIPNVTSFTVYQQGETTVEQYWRGHQRNRAMNIKSASKTILSTLTALALQDGYIESIDDPIARYIPDYMRGLQPEAKQRNHGEAPADHVERSGNHQLRQLRSVGSLARLDEGGFARRAGSGAGYTHAIQHGRYPYFVCRSDRSHRHVNPGLCGKPASFVRWEFVLEGGTAPRRAIISVGTTSH